MPKRKYKVPRDDSKYLTEKDMDKVLAILASKKGPLFPEAVERMRWMLSRCKMLPR